MTPKRTPWTKIQLIHCGRCIAEFSSPALAESMRRQFPGSFKHFVRPGVTREY